ATCARCPNPAPLLSRLRNSNELSCDRAVCLRLAVDRRDVIRGDVAVRPKRIDVRISPSRRGVADLLAPVDAERRVDGGEDVLHARLLLATPACLDALGAFRIGAAQHQAALDAGAG